MAFAIKAGIADAGAESFSFAEMKTMYGGRRIAVGDIIFVFAAEHQGGQGLIARGIVTAAAAIPRPPGPARYTPRVSLAIARTALARRRLGRSELRHLSEWQDGQPGSELNFKFYRQATNKIIALSDAAAAFLDTFFCEADFPLQASKRGPG